ncbi:hypothetical protein D3C81_2137820 [compost metagenome]
METASIISGVAPERVNAMTMSSDVAWDAAIFIARLSLLASALIPISVRRFFKAMAERKESKMPKM